MTEPTLPPPDRRAYRPRSLAGLAIALGIVFVILGAILTPIAVSRLTAIDSVTANGVHTEGLVVAVEIRERGLAISRRYNSVATVEFETAEGESRTTTLEKAAPRGEPSYVIGERLALVYDRSDPGRIVNAGPEERSDAYGVVVIGCSMLGGGLVTALIGTLVSRRRPGGRTIRPSAG